MNSMNKIKPMLCTGKGQASIGCELDIDQRFPDLAVIESIILNRFTPDTLLVRIDIVLDRANALIFSLNMVDRLIEGLVNINLSTQEFTLLKQHVSRLYATMQHRNFLATNGEQIDVCITATKSMVVQEGEVFISLHRL